MSGIFRQQAVNAQRQKLHGDISLAQPMSIYTTAFLLLGLILAIGIFLSFSHYARKETVRGYLVPDKGIIKTYANRSGNIETLHVKAGESVSKGTPLATMVLNRTLSSGRELSENLIDELQQQRQLLKNEKSLNARLKLKETTQLQTSIADYKKSQTLLENMQQLVSQKLALQLEQKSQHQKLLEGGYLSALDYRAQQEKLINIKQELQSLKASHAEQQRFENEAQARLSSLTEQYALKATAIDRQDSDLLRQIDETENNYRYVIRATAAGTVAAIQVVEGEFINGNRPLMSLIPSDAVLVAELMLPTRSAGFVQPGDEARLRFDAFPYQRFGFISSKITGIDKALLLDGEANMPVTLSEPVYPVRTQLSQQYMQAYAKQFSLKSGMLLEADIMLDSRSLLDWLLDPIYSLRGRIG